jgi:spermidine/putrescine-binding protein
VNKLSSTTRRWLAVATGLALIGTACGSDASPDDDAAPEATDARVTNASDTTDAGSDPAVAVDVGEIDYFGWEGYDTFFGGVDPLLAELGVEFNSTYMGAPSDIPARFASGGGDGIDLLAWTSAENPAYHAVDGVLSPIAPEEVPNLAGLLPAFADDTWDQFQDDDGNWLMIPFSFAPLGITYDSTKVSPTSYADLLDPSLTGQVGIPDIPGLHIQAAAAALGYESQDLTAGQLDEVVAFMQTIWSQARTVSPSYGDIIGLLASGEIMASYGGYPGLGAFTENPDIVTAFPEEGTFSFVEVFSIPAGADNREGALAFINAMLDPANNAAINDVLAQATTVTESIPLMSEANAALYPYSTLDEFFANNPVMSVPTGENGTIDMGDFIEKYAALSTGG